MAVVAILLHQPDNDAVDRQGEALAQINATTGDNCNWNHPFSISMIVPVR
jgi:hypothetical protein